MTVISISGTRHNPRKELPPAADLAAMIREGETAADIGEAFGCSPRTVAQRLNDAGISSTTGEEYEAKKPSVQRHMTYRPLAPQTWADRAKCAEIGGDLWFPEKEGDGSVGQRFIRDAKAICNTCPVALECLRWALDHDEQHGIWGGMTPTERRRMLVEKRPRRCALDECNELVTGATSAKYCTPAHGRTARNRRYAAGGAA
jgi:WhiB family redox-sensing transcriptional regulator